MNVLADVDGPGFSLDLFRILEDRRMGPWEVQAPRSSASEGMWQSSPGHPLLCSVLGFNHPNGTLPPILIVKVRFSAELIGDVDRREQS